jgi:hypothetical protein
MAYNNLSEQSAYLFEDSASAIQPLTMTDVIASDCWIWQHFDGLQTAENVQSSTQWEAICVKDKFDRSLEELGFLREEIQNVKIFWQKHLAWIRQTLSSLSNDLDPPVADGCRALLAAEYQRINKKLSDYALRFGNALNEITTLREQNKDDASVE